MEDFVPGATYTAVLEAGAQLVDGSLTTTRHEHTFQVECSSVDDERCPPVVVTDDPTIALPEPTATRTPTATQPPSPTPTRSGFTIDGCVAHFGACGPSQEFGVVRLEPLGRTVDVDYGLFAFEDVPPGDYILTYGPPCNPRGCTGEVRVRIADGDGHAAFNRSSCPADCSVDFGVTVDEVLLCVTMALEGGGVARCPHCDRDLSGRVTVDELVVALNTALNGCP